MADHHPLHGNLFRAYPLRPGQGGLPPPAALADLGVVLAAGDYDPAEHPVYLAAAASPGPLGLRPPPRLGTGWPSARRLPPRLGRLADYPLTLDFRCDHPLVAGRPLRFVVPGRAGRYRAVFDDGSGEDRWWGYLVAGDPAALAGWLAAAGGRWSGRLDAECGCVTAGGGVARVRVFNTQPPGPPVPAGCDPPPPGPPPHPGDLVPAGVLEGEVVVAGGFNLRAAAGPAGLVLTAALGAGAGPNCGDPADAGGAGCGGAVRWFGGAGGPDAAVEAGRGAEVVVGPGENTLTVRFPAAQAANCGGL